MMTLNWRNSLTAVFVSGSLAVALPLAATAQVNNPGLLVHAADFAGL